MVVYNFSRQGSFALDQGVKSWDPSTVFGITNPDTRGFTCVGYAPSCGRRCRNPIAQCNRQKVFDMLDEIALLSPNSRAVTSKLAKIAFLSLCVRNHRGQVEEVVSEWQTRISSMKPRAAGAKSWRVDEDANSLQTSLRNAAPRPSRQAPQTHSSQKPTTSAKASPTPAGEEQRRQEIHEKRRQEQERLRKEKLKKEEEEREREREAEKKRRQRASERKQEEEERLKRAKAAKEKKEWEKAWKSYIEGWDIFRATESIPASSIRSAIPWPVKDGRYSEVKFSAVKDFYMKACPDSDNPTLMFKLMQKESLKWHPDKICALFRGASVGEAEKMVVDVIAKAVIELRGQANEKRNG